MKKKANPQQQVFDIISEFCGQNNIITAPRIFVKIFDDIAPAIFLSQLLYWQNKMKGDWLFKTYKTWKEEIGLSEYEIKKASKLFKEIGFLETKIQKAIGNPTVHYKLNNDKFLEWFLKILSIENENFKKPYIKNINKEVLSKDNTEAIQKESPIIKPFIFLEYWNDLKKKTPMIQQHLKPETKIYKRAVKLIKHLKNGTFGDTCHIDTDFIERNHIRKALLNKKYSDGEIYTGIDRLTLLFKEGYWPKDKSRLPKDLSSLIHNTRTNTSWFLSVISHPPKPINRGKTEEQIDNEVEYSKENPKMTDEEIDADYERREQEWLKDVI